MNTKLLKPLPGQPLDVREMIQRYVEYEDRMVPHAPPPPVPAYVPSKKVPARIIKRTVSILMP